MCFRVEQKDYCLYHFRYQRLWNLRNNQINSQRLQPVKMNLWRRSCGMSSVWQWKNSEQRNYRVSDIQNQTHSKSHMIQNFPFEPRPLQVNILICTREEILDPVNLSLLIFLRADQQLKEKWTKKPKGKGKDFMNKSYRRMEWGVTEENSKEKKEGACVMGSSTKCKKDYFNHLKFQRGITLLSCTNIM